MGFSIRSIVAASFVALAVVAPSSTVAQGHPQPCVQRTFEEARFTVCAFDSEKDELKLVVRDASGKAYRRLPKLAEAMGDRALDVSFAMNAGMFDAMGAPIAYRDLSVKVCEGRALAGTACSEGMAPPSCTGELAGTSEPTTLTAVAAYSANVQGLVSFQLPTAFNERTDTPPTEVDTLDAASRKTRLLALRDSDPRAVRILVTQPQGNGAITVWDSRCEEDLFSDDEWSKLKYYRVGKNEYRSVFAPLRKAQTTTP